MWPVRSPKLPSACAVSGDFDLVDPVLEISDRVDAIGAGENELVGTVATEQQVIPCPAVQRVVADATIEDELHAGSGDAGRVDDVVASEAIDHDWGVGTSCAGNGDRLGEAADRHSAVTSGKPDVVVTDGATVDTLLRRIRGDRRHICGQATLR